MEGKRASQFDRTIEEQSRQVEVRTGEDYCWKEYNHLIASEASWFSQMSNVAKQRHLNTGPSKARGGGRQGRLEPPHFLSLLFDLRPLKP